MMASRDECRWVVLCRGVAFRRSSITRSEHRECMDKIGQKGRDEWTKLKNIARRS